MKKRKHTVALIDRSELLLSGLNSVVGSSEEFVVIGQYADVESFREHLGEETAEVVIVNPQLIPYGKRGGIKAIFPKSMVVALVYNYIDRETLAQFHEVIELYDKPARMIHKLEQVVEQANNEPSGSETEELSEREKEILIAVAKGLINKEIASLHNLSIHTVITHRKNISRKLGIKSVSGFGVYALLNNLIEEYEIQ